MKFRTWLEMATFAVPFNVNFNITIDGTSHNVGYIDMRFEDPPQVRNNQGRVLNQGSQFLAKIPGTTNYLVYNGLSGPLNHTVNSVQANVFQASGYSVLHDDWWKRAQLVSKSGELISIGEQDAARKLTGVI